MFNNFKAEEVVVNPYNGGKIGRGARGSINTGKKKKKMYNIADWKFY